VKVLVAALPLVAGCAVPPEAPIANATTVRAVQVDDDTPPPPKAHADEVRPGFVWIDGRYERVGRSWRWREGYYERERSGYVWVQGRWERQGRRHVWVEGHWLRL
jgi:hypothetical protein